MFLGLGAAEVMVILVIALVVLGPDKLPAVAKQLARMLKELRRVSDDVRQQFDAEEDGPVRRPSVALPAAAAATVARGGPEPVTGPAGVSPEGTAEKSTGAEPQPPASPEAGRL